MQAHVSREWYRPFQDRRSCPDGVRCDGHLNPTPAEREQARLAAQARVSAKRAVRVGLKAGKGRVVRVYP